MEYKLLSRLYYQDKEQYIELYNQRYNSENTYHFNIKIHNNEAFCCLCPEIYTLSSNIAALDKKVMQISSSLPQVAINQFASKCLVDEIILTNDIEGVYSTRKEISLILNDAKNRNHKKRFYGLVTKYTMLNKGKIPLKTCTDIRNIYDELVLPEVKDDDPANVPDGKIFRKDLADVTTSTQKVIHSGIQPESNIIFHIEQALKILNDENIPLLIRTSVFHYLFGYIHPFYDGNGRTSRFISSYMLSKEFEYLIGYRLSYTIKENISEYYEAFKICNKKENLGDLTPFIITFLKIISKSFEKLYEALYKRKLDLDKYEEKINHITNIDTNVGYVLLQASLFSRLGINKKELCNTLKISETTLDKRLKSTENAGYLIIKKNGRTNHYSFNIDKLQSTFDDIDENILY